MGLYNRTVRKFVQQLRGVEEEEAQEHLVEPAPPPSMDPVQQSMEEDLVCPSLTSTPFFTSPFLLSPLQQMRLGDSNTGAIWKLRTGLSESRSVTAVAGL